ncbi:MAG: Ribosomal RNA small subunit methyltransferase I [Candidatus Collierbacteria bacterium GW2011_GWE1_46_18]|uniref:Ribosomal RNA small subunit methyltransferase I n=1 Tax=Candidatus Collierbacteria bacterium GW2011_GWE1_46_18 TaxID=1618399 RepID=A0A0G1PAM6_9BACT|nr:MAG: Ribosomal RNA small subunit methyltransferase I [Candidatus Collierbacteria bacterium GW2011_GWE1_46_18]
MKLSVVGLPIGNIEDISLRAIRTIQETGFIVCEDTRVFNSLWMKLTQMGLATKLSATLRFINDFNEERVLLKILNEMSTLDSAVLVSDAGMPLISDPGYKLVKHGLEMGWEVDVVPGPTAESAALAISGLPTDKYIFLGFLPKKPGKKHDLLVSLKNTQEQIKCSGVIYEAPPRLIKLLTEIKDVFGDDGPVFVGFDLTKQSQRVYRGNVVEVLGELSEEKMKGEITVIIGR